MGDKEQLYTVQCSLESTVLTLSFSLNTWLVVRVLISENACQ